MINPWKFRLIPGNSGLIPGNWAWLLKMGARVLYYDSKKKSARVWLSEGALSGWLFNSEHSKLFKMGPVYLTD